MSGGQRTSRSQSSCRAYYLSGTKWYRLLLVEFIGAGLGLCILSAAVVQHSLMWDATDTMRLYRF